MQNTYVRFANKELFKTGVHIVTPLSWQRARQEYSFAGLDGTVSVDLGRRARQIKQRGTLVAGNREELEGLIAEIEAAIDGQAYELIDRYGVSYQNVRMDHFTRTSPVQGGNQTRCEYEIVYTQLQV